MTLRRELLMTIGVLVVLNLLLAFGTIGLLMRMGPAIDGILQENVVSIVAAEEILVELAQAAPSPLSTSAQRRVQAALAQAQQNVTEPAEGPILQRVEKTLPAAFATDLSARQELIENLRKLIDINRLAMRRVDEKARSLGSAGAWAAVFLGFLSFLLSLLVIVQLQRRFVGPLIELFEVLNRARAGDRLRRCQQVDAPSEVVQVMNSVNALLDERTAHRGR